jgi:hypothetical protein
MNDRGPRGKGRLLPIQPGAIYPASCVLQLFVRLPVDDEPLGRRCGMVRHCGEAALFMLVHSMPWLG